MPSTPASSAAIPPSPAWRRLVDDEIRALASAAGIANDWIDASDQPHRVAVGPLRMVLRALGYPCDLRSELDDSKARLRRERMPGAGMLVTAIAGQPIALPQRGTEMEKDAAAELEREDGTTVPIMLRMSANGPLVPAVEEPG